MDDLAIRQKFTGTLSSVECCIYWFLVEHGSTSSETVFTALNTVSVVAVTDFKRAVASLRERGVLN